MAYEEISTSTTGGQKAAKLARFSLIPVKPLWSLAELYGKGATKYADRNWELGYDYSLSYDALQRHLQAFWTGQRHDADGNENLAAVAFHTFALMTFESDQKYNDFDDRPFPAYVDE